MHPEVPEPGYLRLYENGELEKRKLRAYAVLSSCTLCPRRCRVDRCSDSRGFCRTGRRAAVSSYGPHFGEEPPLVGSCGSGTVFVTHCTMACGFCQNYNISQCGDGREVTPDELAGMMTALQERGCHNINIVTPTHIVPQFIHAVEIACGHGLRIPLVYNSGGYDSVETLRLLDGIIDIYMPDAKYGDDSVAERLSRAPDYVGVMKSALKEMHRQVGDLLVIGGIARRGMIIRHLVLPENLAGSDTILPWIASGISRDAYVNIMDQYRPVFHALHAGPGRDVPYPAMRRRITKEEFRRVIGIARDCRLNRGF